VRSSPSGASQAGRRTSSNACGTCIDRPARGWSPITVAFSPSTTRARARHRRFESVPRGHGMPPCRPDLPGLAPAGPALPRPARQPGMQDYDVSPAPSSMPIKPLISVTGDDDDYDASVTLTENVDNSGACRPFIPANGGWRSLLKIWDQNAWVLEAS